MLTQFFRGGIPSLRSLCDRGPITRLTWVAAGVPRDAINIFQQALTKSISRKSKKVSITSVNLSAGEAVEDKKRYLEIDSSGTHEEAMKLFEEIKTFCTKQKNTNAFLIKIDSSNENFQNVQKLIDLRLFHVLTKEITPDEAGVKYIALLLDYGSYTGIRLARSVGVFQTKLQALKYNDLRKLPKFNLNQYGTS